MRRARIWIGHRLISGLALAAIINLAVQSAAWAWSNHTLCTWQAVAPLAVAGESVPAESFTGFLTQEAGALAQVLEQEEQWTRQNVPFYAPRPDRLRFQAPSGAGDDPASLRRAFLRAIRANESMPMELYVQHPPGTIVPAEREMVWSSLGILESLGDLERQSLERLEPGAMVKVADIIATASNEPDFGLDIGLWLDNGGSQGPEYGYGSQPFGNPRLDYGSQAPFHMGFHHEHDIVYAAAGYLQHTYPEARIHLYMTLSRFAFAQGHPYWGWRFAGLAIHYVQDLAQPYHARVLPGIGTANLLWISLLDQMGFHGPKNAAVILVSNRHTVVENYQYRRMKAAYEKQDMDDPLLVALRDMTDDPSLPLLLPASVRVSVSAPSAAAADELDAQLERSFPALYVADPDKPLDHVEHLDMHAIALQSPQAEQDKLTALVADRMRQTGRDTRAVIRAVSPVAVAAKP